MAVPSPIPIQTPANAVNPDTVHALIWRRELLPPFAYLKHATDRVQNGEGNFEGKQKPALWLVNVRVISHSIPLTGLEPVPLPPEGNALSTEL